MNPTASPEKIEQRSIARALFWSTFVLGSLVLAFLWLLSRVPGSDLLLDYVVRSVAAALILTSILIARRIWRFGSLVPDRGPIAAMQLVLLIAWAELMIALASVVGIVVMRR